MEIDGFKCFTLEQRLARNVRPVDTISRLAPGQFPIALHAAGSIEEALHTARALLRSFDESLPAADAMLRTTVSIGIATSSDWTSSGP